MSPNWGRRSRRRPTEPVESSHSDASDAASPSAGSRSAGAELHERALAISRAQVPEEESIAAFRSLVTEADFDTGVMQDYATFLIDHSRGSAAEEVLALALARDGARVDALEMYLELVRELHLPSARAHWALRRLEQDIAESPVEHRGALDYAIPHRLTTVLSTVEAHGDPVSTAIVRINAAYAAGTTDASALVAAVTGLGENDRIRSHIAAALGRGNHQLAMELLETADPRAVPINSLRRAIRRARANDATRPATRYLRAYLALRPDDGWGKTLLSDMEKRSVSNYQLGKTGFPVPRMATAPAFETNPRRVFYLLHNSLPFNSAGYATRTHGLLTELNHTGWDVDGVTRLGYPYDMPGNADLPDVPAVEQIDGVDYRRLLTGHQIEKKNPLFDYVQRYSAELVESARRERPAILHAASNHWNGLTAVSVARRLGLPSIYEIRGLWEVTRGSRNPEWAQSNMYRYIARMEADAAQAATRVFAITGALRDEMIERGVDGDKITILPNGVDTSRFTPIPRDQELAQELGVTGKTVIGYVGSILDYEGLELLIDAAAELAATRTDFHVLIVGDGAELESFTERVHDQGLDEVVTFTGRVPHEHVERYYSLIDITPFPRLPLPVCEMVSPLKPFEAMAMGKAVIASDVAALKEIVTPGVNGFLHTKGEARSLQFEIERLLDDRDLLRSTGEKARNWVVSNRDWRSIAATVSETYADLSERGTLV